MYKSYCDPLYLQLEERLQQISQNEKEPLIKLTESLKLIKEALSALKIYFFESPSEKREEIDFFKNTKPRFYSLLIFEIELYRLVNCQPTGGKEQLTAYYLEELKYVERFFLQNQFQYQYFRLDATELDHLYFIRKVDKQSPLLPELPEIDPEFSTSCSYLFSKFKAFEMLREQIINELERTNKAGTETFIRPGRKYNPLNWTGDVINAVELGYGLWMSDQLNSGNVELTDIMHWLSTTLNVDLSRYTRLFTEIKDRKIISKTRFIDMMRDAINRYMEDSNAIRPVNLRKAKRKSLKPRD